MDSTLIIGAILIVGFIFGEIASKMRLPRITGYILAGILLNPQLSSFVPKDFMRHTNFATNVSLSFITFAVVAFRLIASRMPVMYEHPDWKGAH